ncbi:hypothetical protein NEMIN01_0676 [Nematocida minor]|uniref:uncharacterized protein n=1 Tax=Nematocida minor TaxID=1912983 RepID=UPI002220353A|nr:uncharacterized protein NEMIN01_0676 [Nematocida minor]KAI5189723.1 hypothetical protein NEMIN01_0676 [Nematocida minor]
MSQEISLLLKETERLLDKNSAEDKDEIHSKLVGLYLSLQEYAEEGKDAFVDQYNLLVDRGKTAGISKIKRIIKKAAEKKETSNVKKRETVENNQNTERIAASILEQSKTLKMKAESFGQMLENSKSFVEKVSSGVRENVKQVQKSVLALENKEWYSLTTGQVVFLLIAALLIFIFMYFLIRVA